MLIGRVQQTPKGRGVSRSVSCRSVRTRSPLDIAPRPVITHDSSDVSLGAHAFIATRCVQLAEVICDPSIADGGR